MQSNVARLSPIDRAWASFETNKKPVLMIAGAIVVVGMVAWFFIWQKSEKEVKASEALSAVSVPQLGQAGARPDTAGAYLKVATEYPDSSAAARALLLGAGSLFVEGKFADAKTQFERFTREHRDSPLFPQAALGLAASHDALGNTNEAVTAYKNLIDRHSSENVVPQAKFALARLYEAQNKPEQAKALFEDVARGDAYSSIGSEAGMRLEELKIKYPQLAAPPPGPAPIVPPVAPTIVTNIAIVDTNTLTISTNPVTPASNPVMPATNNPPGQGTPEKPN